MFDGFDPRKERYDPYEEKEEEFAEKLFWENQPAPTLTPEQLRVVEYVRSGNFSQDEATLKTLLLALTPEEREQVETEKRRRANLPPALNFQQQQALQRLENVREQRIKDVVARVRAEAAALVGLTDQEKEEVREVDERRVTRWFAENLPGRKAELARKAWTPQQIEDDRRAVEERDAEVARWAAQEARADAARKRRAPDVDPRYGEDNPWGAPRALERTGKERTFRVFAEARTQIVHSRRAKLQPGWLVYTVWANKLQHAAFLAERELFAAGPGEPGVRSITNGDDDTILDQAPYLQRRASP